MPAKLYRGKLPKELDELIKLCRSIRSNRKVLDFLWSHTASEYHYDAIVDAITYLSSLKSALVTWKIE